MSVINKEIQQQDPGSALIELYELEYADNTFAYFYPGLDDDLTVVQFRDSGGSTVRDYQAVPMEVSDFEIKSDGAHSRPEVVIGNIGNILTSAIGGLDLEDLTGRRLTKRTTLEKYLVGNSGDTSPPIEFPKLVYVIDRLKERNILSATFELASPFDVAGVSLPKRQIIGGSCPFKYKAASRSVLPLDRVGGCDWNNKSNVSATASSAPATRSIFVYMNRYDEYVVPDGITFSSLSTVGSASVQRGHYYKTNNPNLLRVSASGTTNSVSGFNYWQSLKTATVGAPSDTDTTNWRRVRVADTYNTSTTYYAYTDPKFNDYILESNTLWQVKKTQDGGSHGARTEGVNWTTGDVCGKKIASCKLRFHANTNTNATIAAAGGVSAGTSSHVPLRFGGFPGAKLRR